MNKPKEEKKKSHYHKWTPCSGINYSWIKCKCGAEQTYGVPHSFNKKIDTGTHYGY